MLTRQQLIKAAISLARDQHSTSRAFGHFCEGECKLTEPSTKGGWEARFEKCGETTYLKDGEIVIRALILQALEAE